MPRVVEGGWIIGRHLFAENPRFTCPRWAQALVETWAQLRAARGMAGAAIGFAINSAANLGKELASTSKQFNIGVESLQVWRQAAATAGISADNLTEGLGTLTEKIGEANAGNKQAQQGFVALGVGFQTASGQARATEAVMLDLAKRIAEIEDPAERVRLGQQLLGDEFKNLHPLLLQGAEGFRQAATDLGQFGAMLSQKEIQQLEQTNAKIEQMKAVLSIRIAGIVAENADSIVGMANAIATLTGAVVKFGNEYPRVSGMLAGAAAGGRFGGLPGAVAGGLGGALVGEGVSRAQADANMDPMFRSAQLRTAQQRVTATTRGTVNRANDPAAQRAKAEYERQLALFAQAVRGTGGGSAGNGLAQSILAPTLSAGGGGAVRRTAGGGGARQTGKSEEDKAFDAALKAEERMRDAVARTSQEMQDAARIATIRREQGEIAAAMAQAELDLSRKIPGIQAQTVEELGKALGYSEKMVETRRKELELQLASNKAEVARTTQAAGGKAWGDVLASSAKLYREAERANQQAAQDWERQHTAAVMDVANIYETAFRGGTQELWQNFKAEGIRMISEIAAQWTIAMISGQKFDLGAAAGGAFGRSPLSSIFFGAGGGRGGSAVGAANDNGFLIPGVGGNGLLGSFAASPAMQGTGGGLAGAAMRVSMGNLNTAAKVPFLKSQGFALGLGSLTTSLVAGNSTAGQIGGMIGSIGGQVLGGKLLGSLGAFAGPVGAIAGALLGSILPKLVAPTKRGSATIGGLGDTLGITGTRGNSSSRIGTSTSAGTSIIDSIFQIADQLGGGVDASRGLVSIGVRKDSFRVDTSGRGITKTKNGAVDFGSDQEAAMRFAISDLIKDGVITGISQASQNLLRGGGDLEKQIEKALLIEQIPKLLRQRTDPLGAALDELYDKFRKVNDALVEGSASAEQFAQARQLWELEKADAIRSIGAASQTLKDFLASLNAGSDSPLSLREQRAEAEKQLAPYLEQIGAAERARAEVDRLRASGASEADIAKAEAAAKAAASAINQDGFTQASQLLLSISRQSNASSGGFFSDFDRIRALTGQAIGFVDQATARGADTRDPFGSAIAQNTGDMAAMLAEQTVLLQGILAAVNDNGGGGGSSFVTEARAFAS